MPWNTRILLIGAGDKGTVTALRLFLCGFRPILLERAHPTDLHYNRNFTDTVYRGEKKVGDVSSLLISNNQFNQKIKSALKQCQDNRKIPLLCHENLNILSQINPEIIVDCTGKYPTPLQIPWQDFPCVIRIGCDYNVGIDGHLIIGDSGDHLSQVLRKPHDFTVVENERPDIVNAPLEGIFISNRDIGDHLDEREIIGTINDINILSPLAGYLTGLLHSGHFVASRQPLCEITPLAQKSELKKNIPVINYAIAGGVLEAILSFIYSRSS
jgi:xanthine dehydrogenase accessory factor